MKPHTIPFYFFLRLNGNCTQAAATSATEEHLPEPELIFEFDPAAEEEVVTAASVSNYPKLSVNNAGMRPESETLESTLRSMKEAFTQQKLLFAEQRKLTQSLIELVESVKKNTKSN